MYDDRWTLLEKRAEELGEDIVLKLSVLKATKQVHNEMISGLLSENKNQEFTDIFNLLIEIFKDGNEQKINAIKAQLKAFAPHEQKNFSTRSGRTD